jgi:acyl-[acyl-carrier-protein]-phospholipid O-acyltransferase/long-chain-fatty-acid--[acyl-carrier-protein] ligase
LKLLSSKKFLPLFLTQFLGAFNDNLFKNALVILITYGAYTKSVLSPNQLITLAAGLFIMPFFLLSALAGQLADKYDRAIIARFIKLAEIGIVCMATLGFFYANIYFLFAVLFAMGMHSTFFGPIKYALLPQHLPESELLLGNAYVEAGTFLAILLGTVFGGILILKPQGVTWLGMALIGFSIMGYLSSRFIPSAPPPDPKLVINLNPWKETWAILRFLREDKHVYRAVLGVSWFWFFGATYLAQFPAYIKNVLHANNPIVTLFLTTFSLGIGFGSWLCHRLLAGVVQATYVPLSVLGMSLFSFDLYFASLHATIPPAGGLWTLAEFLSLAAHWRIIADLFAMAVCGGMFVVPLYAIMQDSSQPQYRARIIAANNILNALFMVVSAIWAFLLLHFDFSIMAIFLSTSLFSFLFCIYLIRLLPDALIRSVFRVLFRLLYRVEIRGLEHYHHLGERSLLIANHSSFIDGLLLAAYLPDKVIFAINTYFAQLPWVKPFLSLVEAFPLDPVNPMAIKSLIERLRKGGKCLIFPEGRLTITGTLMKIYEGPGLIAEKAKAKVLPIRIDGAQYTPFSRLRGRVRLHWFPKITITLLAPVDFCLPEQVRGRERRQLMSSTLYDLMTDMMYKTSPIEKTLFEGLIEAQFLHGRSHGIVEDIERRTLNYGSLMTKSFSLGRILERQIPAADTCVALLLPNAVATSVAFFALQAHGKTTAMLNFSAGVSALQNACKAAKVSYIISSRRFVQISRFEKNMADLEATGLRIMYLEDLKAQLRVTDLIWGWLSSYLPSFRYRWITANRNPHDAAVILFTSGSEGTPKGVCLSHVNLQANRYQMASRIDFSEQDIVFNCLPMFHAFGLVAATLLPILSGIKIFFYPSPLHYRIVPELVYDTNATLLFGTDTFLAGYARFAHAYDFHTLRYIFSGAEKLKEDTRKIYVERFGIRVFEGYGATETSPVISINTPMQCRAGSVGKLLPDIAVKLERIPGIVEGEKLLIKGPNIMMGYLFVEKPGELQPPPNGWYDTGDIVAFDEQQFLFIKGRSKRFAKIAGEMVSLTALEGLVSLCWPGYLHAAVSVPHPKKGEEIILVTTLPEANLKELQGFLKMQKFADIGFPKKCVFIKTMPLLGTGKTDYQKLREWLNSQ